MSQHERLKEFVRSRSPPTPSSSTSSSSRRTCATAAVDVILLDTTFWGGIRPCIKAAGVCETMPLGVAVHSSGELGIQLATMLHMGAVVPNLGYAADAHYHHLRRRRDRGRPDALRERRDRVPDAPGSGVTLDRAKLAQYHELFRELGGYPYDRDPGRPGWYPLIPNSAMGRPETSRWHAEDSRIDAMSATTGRQDGAGHGGRTRHRATRRAIADGRGRRDGLRDRREGRAARKLPAASPTSRRAQARRARRRGGRVD